MTTTGFLIAAPSSGSGKSMLTTGLMAVYSESMRVQGFKVGPDFIDPMYHRAATGQPSYNLDPWMLSAEQNRRTYHDYAKYSDLCITEGVMGLFDATGADPLENSTAGLAHLLGLPVILVVDCARMSGSVAAIIHGFHTWVPEIKIAGVIGNRIGSVRHERLLRDAIQRTAVPVIGMIPNQKELGIPSRHLGLFTVTERESAVTEYIETLKPVIRANIDLPLLLQIAGAAPKAVSRTQEISVASQSDISNCDPARERTAEKEGPQETANKLIPDTDRSGQKKVRIGIAYDQAFCFYYEANLQALRDAGAELVFFSPLTANTLPGNLHGLYFGGGYPELYGQQLSANSSLLQSIRSWAKQKAPIYAECGGLVYLTEGIHTADEAYYPLVGLLPGDSRMQKKLIMGYRSIRALRENWLFSPNVPFRGHEFHYSVWENPEQQHSFLEIRTARPEDPARTDGYAKENLIASYIHIHFAQNPILARNFIQKAQECA